MTRRIRAPAARVYRAFIDPAAVASWLPPGDMRGKVHLFEPRVGGAIRMSLTYQDPTDAGLGKTLDDTDTFTGSFAELVPNRLIVWRVEFESEDTAFAGVMMVHWILDEVDGQTDVTALCEGIPEGIRLQDNEEGSRSSLAKLADFLE